MRLLFVGLTIFLGTKSFAAKIFEFYNHETKEISVLIPEPLISNSIGFDGTSDQNGVCIALGYEKGAPGAAAYRNTNGSTAIVRSDGMILSGRFSATQLINLICVNKIRDPYWKGEVFDLPLHPNAGPFTSDSNVNGACKVLGFQRGIPGSQSWRGFIGSTVKVNEDGVITAGGYNTAILTNLACLNYVL